jgi:hypothetical protein
VGKDSLLLVKWDGVFEQGRERGRFVADRAEEGGCWKGDTGRGGEDGGGRGGGVAELIAVEVDVGELGGVCWREVEGVRREEEVE